MTSTGRRKPNLKPTTDPNKNVPVIDLTADDTLIVIDDSMDAENVLLAGGDGNTNVKTPKKSEASAEFLSRELASSTPASAAPSTPQSGGKRKRSDSPDFELEEDSGEGSEEESFISAVTNKTSGPDKTSEMSFHTVVDESVSDQTPDILGDIDSTLVDISSGLDSPSPPISELSTTDVASDSLVKQPESQPKLVIDKFTGMELPHTVTVLTTPEGSRVYLVGTAHFSKESQDDVSHIIRTVNPHIVCLELCKARTNILQLDEKTILEEAKNINLEKVRTSVRQNGLVNGLMYILLLNMSAHLTKQLGMAPGGEFRRALAEVRQLNSGCMVHLSDRPLDVTIKRALHSLSWWQTLKLTWHLITSKEPISKQEVERCKQRDLLEEMLKEMAGEFPQLGQCFIEERDTYLAYSLQLAALPHPNKPQGDVTKVVGVVGIGHVAGIVRRFGKVTEQEIGPLLLVPTPSRSSRAVKLCAKASLAAAAVFLLVRFAPRPSFMR